MPPVRRGGWVFPLKTHTMIRYLARAAWVLLGLTVLGGSMPLHPQSLGGTILLKVTDATRADLFDVAITVVNSATGARREVRTDEYGKYALEALPPGLYTIKAEGPGLKTGQVKGVKLAAGGRQVVDLIMEPGEERISPGIAKPQPVTMARLANLRTSGVSAVEVTDYVYGNYKGTFAPSPPHADLNPRKAYIVYWKDSPQRLVFSHEASYCPWLELPSGAGLCYQFFEGNTGWAELMNQWGRLEANSFVSIIESGPKRVWVRWTYFGANLDTGQKAYRGIEDFWAYPNGLVVRRQEYEPLLAGEFKGYSREPIELIGMCPVGKLWFERPGEGSRDGRESRPRHPQRLLRQTLRRLLEAQTRHFAGLDPPAHGMQLAGRRGLARGAPGRHHGGWLALLRFRRCQRIPARLYEAEGPHLRAGDLGLDVLGPLADWVGEQPGA